ncbi:MAG: ROK family protein, partial [Victivallales bacterium]|nr:ROK family protein [Victivallales bacterium]
MPDIIGIDIGGTKCTLAKADMNGQIMSEPIQFATTNVHATLAEIYAIVDSLKPGDSPVFGIACGGPLDSANGIVLSPPNLPGWDHI